MVVPDGFELMETLVMVGVIRDGLLRDLVVPDGFELKVDWAHSQGDIDVRPVGMSLSLGVDVDYAYIKFSGDGVVVVNGTGVWVEYCDPGFLGKVQDLVNVALHGVDYV